MLVGPLHMRPIHWWSMYIVVFSRNFTISITIEFVKGKSDLESYLLPSAKLLQ